MKLLLAAALALLASAPGWAAESPEAVLKRIYAEEGAVVAPARLPDYYSRDLAAALRKDQDSDEVGAVGFDWLYDAQDAEITDLTFEAIADGPDGSLIEARFRNFDEPKAVRWTLCRRPNGDWRVSDVATDAWSLRQLLSLPPEPATC